MHGGITNSKSKQVFNPIVSANKAAISVNKHLETITIWEDTPKEFTENMLLRKIKMLFKFNSSPYICAQIGFQWTCP